MDMGVLLYPSDNPKEYLMGEQPKQKYVLIVVDTERLRKKVKEALKGKDISLRSVACIADAFSALMEKKKPDLCILTNKIGDRDEGLDFLRQLRMDGDQEPVIIYSNTVTAEGQREIQRLGGIFILWNPEDTGDELAKAVERLLTT